MRKTDRCRRGMKKENCELFCLVQTLNRLKINYVVQHNNICQIYANCNCEYVVTEKLERKKKLELYIQMLLGFPKSCTLGSF